MRAEMGNNHNKVLNYFLPDLIKPLFFSQNSRNRAINKKIRAPIKKPITINNDFFGHSGASGKEGPDINRKLLSNSVLNLSNSIVMEL